MTKVKTHRADKLNGIQVGTMNFPVNGHKTKCKVKAQRDHFYLTLDGIFIQFIKSTQVRKHLTKLTENT